MNLAMFLELELNVAELIHYIMPSTALQRLCNTNPLDTGYILGSY